MSGDIERLATTPADLVSYIKLLEARLDSLERANNLTRGSWHDGTRTRGQVGYYTDPDSSTEEQGIYLLDSSGNELLRVNDSAVLITGETATLNADTDVSANSWVLDEDTLTSDSDTKLATQQSIKAYVDAAVPARSFAVADVDTSNDLNDGTANTRTITSSSLGTGWSVSSNTLLFTGSPTYVIVRVNVSFTNTTGNQRVAPVVELHKSTTKLAHAHTGYIRNTGGHDEASANFVYVDTAPGTNPAYHLESSKGSTVSGVCNPLALSTIVAEAVT